MIGTLFRVEVEQVKRQAFIDFIEEDIRVAKEREPGTLRFDLYQDPKDENAFFVYEAYRDQKAFEDHQNHEPYQRWESHIRPEMVTCFESVFERLLETINVTLQVFGLSLLHECTSTIEIFCFFGFTESRNSLH